MLEFGQRIMIPGIGAFGIWLSDMEAMYIFRVLLG
jgi:hypothetical protein